MPPGPTTTGARKERLRLAGLRETVAIVVTITSVLLALTGRPANAHDDPGAQLVELTRRIESDPKDASLYLRRADLFRTRGEWTAAVSDLQAARRLAPDLDTVDFALARVLFEAGTPGPALEASDRFLAARPDHAGAHLLRARVLVALGRPREAAAELTRGIELSTRLGSRAASPDDYLERARLLACPPIGDTAGALAGLDEGVQALGGAIALQMLAIDLEVERKDWDAALARIAAVERRAQRKETWIVRRGDVLAVAGRREEAGRAYGEALAAIDALPARLRTTDATAKLAAHARERRADPSSVSWKRLSGDEPCAPAKTSPETSPKSPS